MKTLDMVQDEIEWLSTGVKKSEQFTLEELKQIREDLETLRIIVIKEVNIEDLLVAIHSKKKLLYQLSVYNFSMKPSMKLTIEEFKKISSLILRIQKSNFNIKIINCDCYNHYSIIDEVQIYEEENIRVEYEGKKAICNKCGNEILLDEIEHYNQEQFEKEYHKKYGGKKK